MLIRILPSNMMAAQPEYVAQPHFMPGEILINGTCVRSPPRRPLRPRPVRLRTGPVRVDARARRGSRAAALTLPAARARAELDAGLGPHEHVEPHRLPRGAYPG